MVERVAGVSGPTEYSRWPDGVSLVLKYQYSDPATRFLAKLPFRLENERAASKAASRSDSSA
ncbi:hypothetical protein D3C83_152420 [compost metagenome]